MSSDHTSIDDAPRSKTAAILSKAKIAGILVLITLFVIVMFQNSESVETKILIMKLTMPRAALLLLTFMLGVAVGVLLAFLRPWRKAKH